MAIGASPIEDIEIGITIRDGFPDVSAALSKVGQSHKVLVPHKMSLLES